MGIKRVRYKKQEIADFWDGDSRIPCPWPDNCWHCGRISLQLDRAHIVALNDGGKDVPSNIHLLCSNCHQDSEYMPVDVYWRWMSETGQHPVQWAMSNLQLLAFKGAMSADIIDHLRQLRHSEVTGNA